MNETDSVKVTMGRYGRHCSFIIVIIKNVPMGESYFMVKYDK